MKAAIGSTEEEDLDARALRGWSIIHGLANLLLDGQVPPVTRADQVERLTRRILLARAERVTEG